MPIRAAAGIALAAALAVPPVVAAARADVDVGLSAAVLAASLCGLVVLAFRTPRGSEPAPAAVPAERVGHEELIDLLLQGRGAGSGDWLWETDDRLRLRGDLRRFEEVAGRDSGELDGMPLPHLLLEPASRAGVVLQALARRENFRDQVVEVRLRGAATATWWRLSGSVISDDAGLFAGYRGVGSDITALRQAQERIAYLATHDALTGLANRDVFQAQAGRVCAASAERPAALLALDLDGFKQVNDSFGHAVGDELLAAVAGILTRCVPKGATVARLGGDEFAILVDGDAGKADALAQAICRALAQPFELGAHRPRIGVSIGIAHAPTHAETARDLARRADLALFKAKAAGRGVSIVFRDAFEREIEERLKLEADIRLGLERGEITLHYQPLLDLAAGDVGVCEALMRWHSPERGDVPPGLFIPAAERGALIVALGRFALARACRDAAAWPLPASVAVNVSPQHLRSADFKADVVAALEASGLPPWRLEIEITEGVFLDKSNDALQALTWLRERGIKVALDDFGTGFSSLNYLIDFPVDKIKIDRAFVSGLLESQQSQAVVDAILLMARRLNIRVVAEGVETTEQALALKLRRCDDLQGFLIARAQPPEDVARLLVELPATLRTRVPALLESSLAAALALKRSA